MWLFIGNTTFIILAERSGRMRACVLLGDVISSRGISDRTEFRETLHAACNAVNRIHEDDIVAPATTLKGVDEIGVVLTARQAVYEITKQFLDAVHPIKIRFGVGKGRIDVGADTKDVAEMDGPAFHQVDELLTRLRETGLLFDGIFGDRTLDRAISDEINMLLRWRVELSQRQREYLLAYETGGTQTAAADELGVTQQAVSKELRNIGWPFVSEIEARLATTLREYDT